MIRTKNFKRTLTFVLALSMLLCCVSAFGSVQASANTNQVNMYFYEPIFSKYGLTSANIYIQTKGNAFNQQVYVRYQYHSNQEWNDVQATYLCTFCDGSKLWRASISSYNTQYSIKYVADGQIYWDNNNGNSYTNEILGDIPLIIKKDDLKINAISKNNGFQKSIYVRYTEDNWNTYKDIPMIYNSTNEDGTENWSTTLNLDSSKSDSFEYCVYQQINGKTCWAHFCDKNFNIGHSYYNI